jgi:CHAT domain-containing protein
MGLIRAFIYAGARAVLASQWPVEDLATFLLMRRFYSVLLRMDRTDLSATLHAAQEWLRELTAGQVRELLPELWVNGRCAEEADLMVDLPPDVRPFAHPRFWAAFVLVGA